MSHVGASYDENMHIASRIIKPILTQIFSSGLAQPGGACLHL